MNEPLPDDGNMSLLEHIMELRNRLMYAGGAVLIAFLGCFYFAQEIYAFLVNPLANILIEKGSNPRMIYTALYEVFFAQIKVSFFTALFIAFPVIAYQFWAFVAPGLYRHEKGALMPYLVLSPLLFFMGGALVYYLIFPLAFEFFLGFETPATENGGIPIELETKVGEYLFLVMRLIFAFGISFQLPLVLTLMARIGAVTSRGLAAKRKFAIVGVFCFAAVLTPPDLISQIGLAIPIMGLYEISIFAVRAVERKKIAAGDYEDDEDLDETDFNDA
ncbi:MAG: twin-arginine translocase subunit TatC [Magnetospiraceae bacterium]